MHVRTVYFQSSPVYLLRFWVWAYPWPWVSIEFQMPCIEIKWKSRGHLNEFFLRIAMTTNQDRLCSPKQLKLPFRRLIQVLLPIIVPIIIPLITLRLFDPFLRIFNGNPLFLNMIIKALIFLGIDLELLLNEKFLPVLFHLFQVIEFKQVREDFQLILVELLLVGGDLLLLFSFG